MSAAGASASGSACVGATGAVGSTMLEVLPSATSLPPRSSRSPPRARPGGACPFAGGEVEVRECSEESIEGFDLVISSAGGSVSAEWAPRFVAAGAVVVDNSSYWRMHDEVPLVVAEVNPEAVDSHHGIVANPNCSTMQMVVALKPIHDAVGIERLIVSDLPVGLRHRAPGGRGAARAVARRARRRASRAAHVYPHRIAFNVLPQVETFKDGDDYTTEERKMMAETRKILGVGTRSGSRRPACACRSSTRTRSRSNLQTREDLDRRRVPRAAGRGARASSCVDDPAEGIYPLAIDAAGRDEVLVGRIRRDRSHERCLNLWIVGDNLRKGAATNAVQVAEVLVERDLVRVPDPALDAG